MCVYVSVGHGIIFFIGQRYFSNIFDTYFYFVFNIIYSKIRIVRYEVVVCGTKAQLDILNRSSSTF